MVVVDLAIQRRALGPGDTRISNEDIQSSIEVLDDLADRLFDVTLVCYVDLVGAACKKVGRLV